MSNGNQIPSGEKLLDRYQRAAGRLGSVEYPSAEQWMELAACRRGTVDPSVFFPEDGLLTEEAGAVCAMCPVRDACLEYAITTGQRDGTWGGVSEKGIRRLRKQIQRAGASERQAKRSGTQSNSERASA